ncbi:helicase-associated domain-containing protein [Yinghuangia seranimata]|uniref:helicase-associated domain-containing protein n=1 Tax=Yinghuangia seranimata TaxID=408067 RepID=UPI00248C821E|nr:helicase-associated domain-containing protein [Yinghuangia seranimata]MDI2131816.1 helicase-associated domain-containing protein [Yinghuangia seranimata]
MTLSTTDSLAVYLASLSAPDLAHIVTTTPTVPEFPRPTTLRHLAVCLADPETALLGCSFLSRGELQLLEVLWAVAEERPPGGAARIGREAGPRLDDDPVVVVDPDALLSLVGGAHHAEVHELAPALDALTARVLAWPEDGRIRLHPGSASVFPLPLGLGAPAYGLLLGQRPEELQAIVRELGGLPAGRKDDNAALAARLLADPDVVRRVASRLDPPARAALEELTEVGIRRDPSADWGYYRRRAANPANVDGYARLRRRGLLLPTGDGWEMMPREVALALRGDDYRVPFEARPPDVPTAPVDRAAVLGASAAAAAAALDQATRLLHTCAVSPPQLLKSGGVGVRELRRLTRELACDEAAVRLWLHVVESAGLVVADQERGQVLPTRTYDEWLDNEPAARLLALVRGWVTMPDAPTLDVLNSTATPPAHTPAASPLLETVSTTPPKSRPPAPLSGTSRHGGLALVARGALLRTLGTQNPDRAVTDTTALARCVAWICPTPFRQGLDEIVADPDPHHPPDPPHRELVATVPVPARHPLSDERTGPTLPGRADRGASNMAPAAAKGVEGEADETGSGALRLADRDAPRGAGDAEAGAVEGGPGGLPAPTAVDADDAAAVGAPSAQQGEGLAGEGGSRGAPPDGRDAARGAGDAETGVAERCSSALSTPTGLDDGGASAPPASSPTVARGASRAAAIATGLTGAPSGDSTATEPDPAVPPIARDAARGAATEAEAAEGAPSGPSAPAGGRDAQYAAPLIAASAHLAPDDGDGAAPGAPSASVDRHASRAAPAAAGLPGTPAGRPTAAASDLAGSSVGRDAARAASGSADSVASEPGSVPASGIGGDAGASGAGRSSEVPSTAGDSAAGSVDLLRLGADLSLTAPCDCPDCRDAAEELEYAYRGRFDAVAFTVAALAEATALGLVADGALTALGGGVAVQHSAAALLAAAEELLPPAVRRARFQADLTVVVAGAPAVELARLLNGCANAETQGRARVWRFGEASVRRHLDAGGTAAGLLAELAEVAVGELPQPLEYLIHAVGRRYGRVRAAPAACVVYSDDEALVTELLHHRALSALRLRRIAPTVLLSAEPLEASVAAMRRAGYAPAAETETGSALVERPAEFRAESSERQGSWPVALPMPEDLSKDWQEWAAELLERAARPAPVLPAKAARLREAAPLLGPEDCLVLADALDRGSAVRVAATAYNGEPLTSTVAHLAMAGDSLYMRPPNGRPALLPFRLETLWMVLPGEDPG